MRETLEQCTNRIVGAVKPLSEGEALEREAKFKAEELDVRRRAVIELRSQWNAPRRHSLFDLKQGQKGKWAQKLAVLEGMAGKGYLAALVGIRGNGKTQMAVELMKHATRNLRTAHFFTAMEFFETVKTTYRQTSLESEQAVIKRFRKPALLVVDEIGKRSENDWENNLLFGILNGRYNDLTDTVLIDNRTKQEFVSTIGASLASRISETGGIIECDWPSFRIAQ